MKNLIEMANRNGKPNRRGLGDCYVEIDKKKERLAKLEEVVGAVATWQKNPNNPTYEPTN